MFLSFPHTLVVVGCVLASVLGVIFVRRSVEFEKLVENNEFTGFAYSVIGLFYGIYLAFTVVVVWQQYQDAEENATAEAVHISALARDSVALQPQHRERIQRALYSYVHSVICHEWPALETGQETDPRTLLAYEEVWNAYYAA